MGWRYYFRDVARSLLIVLSLSAPSFAADSIFSDDFGRPDGPVGGWTVFRGSWTLIGGQLTLPRLSSIEHWIWAGNPPQAVPANANAVSFSFDLQFQDPGTNPGVGRHGGFAFCASQATQRGQAGFNGYYVDWIDRVDDRGLRFTRVDNGQLTELVLGALNSPADPPLAWRIELDADNVRLFGDDQLYIDFPDATYRGGYFGFWTWEGGQRIAADNLAVEGELEPLAACFTFAPAVLVAGEPVSFDAGCSVASGGNQITSYEWDFGDGQSGNGAVVEHGYAFPDSYTVTLTVRDAAGHADSVAQDLGVRDQCLPYEDAFDRPPGPADGWTTFQGNWMVSDLGQLQTQTAGQEAWVWAGDPPCLANGNLTLEFEMEFQVRPADVVGRHAGVFFFAEAPAIRWQTKGYDVWWIDRAQDFGISIRRWDGNNQFTFLTQGTFDQVADPPRSFRVEVSGPQIRVLGDGVPYLEVTDDRYRAGYFGFWAYANGQDVLFDNVKVDGEPPPAVVACFAAPTLAVEGKTVRFDASCSLLAAPAGATWSWDFGDGSSGSGETVDHAYSAEGSYTVVLTLKDGAGNSDATERTLQVGQTLLPFTDCFDGPPGPPAGWTASQGTWAIDDAERLGAQTPATGAQADEHWIWAGEPPRILEGDFVAEFTLEFLTRPAGDVGRHAGAFFFAGDPTLRWGTSGYDVWWIDRGQDLGLSLRRWDRGAITFLTAGTFDLLADPPRVWRIEADGPALRLFGDGQLFVEAEDDTYRSGFFGFWAYSNGQDLRFDDLRIGGAALPSCGGEVGPRFVRGDVDSSGDIGLTDPIRVLNWLFLGGGVPECEAAADSDGSGAVDLTDPIGVLNWLYLGGPPPARPGPSDASYLPADCGPLPGGSPFDCGLQAEKCR